MTKSIQQIKHELDDTKAAAAERAVELQDRYRNYLELLSQSVKQQLILASYHICTQFYPQSFLDLSLSNKQDLLQSLREVGSSIKLDLLSIIEQQELEPQPSELNLMAELIKNLPKTKIKSKISEDTEASNQEDGAEIDIESVKAELAKIELIEIEDLEDTDSEEEENDFEDLEAKDLNRNVDPTPQASVNEKIEFDNPKHLLLWHKQIERKIKKNLDRTSKQANKQLQNSKIIPDRIPSKIIDVAMQTEGNKGSRNNRRLPNAPNILHLTIEVDPKKTKIPQSLSQISLLRLRLAEIEFGDPMLNAQRGQIRNLVGKIGKLNSQYKSTKKQLAVAEAQAAWRSSWYED
ncbi:MAG: hypothetical protein ACFCAD_27910 [Pleurocapsa sp.]